MIKVSILGYNSLENTLLSNPAGLDGGEHLGSER